MWQGLIKALRTAVPSQRLPKECFISHAYADWDVCTRLIAELPRYTKPILYPPITVPPEHLVSTPLVNALTACDGLIYLSGGASDRSFWVAFERDYALRLKKPVFAANSSTLKLSRCTDRPLDLAVFASYSQMDSSRVHEVCEFMKRERHFDVWRDIENIEPGQVWHEAINTALDGYLRRGYVVLFWSRHAAADSELKRQLQQAAERIDNFDDRVRFALLDDTPLPGFWIRYKEPGIQIFGDERRSSHQRLDDLIVRLYWLIYRKTEHRRINSQG